VALAAVKIIRALAIRPTGEGAGVVIADLNSEAAAARSSGRSSSELVSPLFGTTNLSPRFM